MLFVNVYNLYFAIKQKFQKHKSNGVAGVILTALEFRTAPVRSFSTNIFVSKLVTAFVTAHRSSCRVTTS